MLLLTWSHSKQQQISTTKVKSPFSFGLCAQQARSHMAAWTSTATRHTETPLCDTHMQQSKEMTAVCARPAQRSVCGDAETKATGRNSTALDHTRIRKGMLSPASDKPDGAFSAFKMNMKQEILTESPWPPCWLWRQLQWTSAGAASGWDAWGVRVWDARVYI